MVFKLLIPAGIAVILVALFLLFTNKEIKYSRVSIGNAEVKAEIADTSIKQARGLMFRQYLPESEGMLFIFDKEDYHGFWMMNTSITLDIIWINKDFEVVHIEKNVRPCGILCPVYKPSEKAKYVLEVNSGFVDKERIDVGHFLNIEF